MTAADGPAEAGHYALRQRPEVLVKQTMKAARWRPWTKHGASHLREDHTWSERHATEQRIAGDVFCRADFSCLRNRCFRVLTQMAGLKPCATEKRDGD